MNRCRPLLALIFTAAALAGGPADAHRRVWGGVSIGIGVPLYYGPYAYPAYPYGYPYYAYPGYVVAPPPRVVYEPVPAAAPAAPVPPAPPEPIFYPRSGQSAAQTEADRQACNRWAMTQRDAVADASVFHRATLACMEGRGYTAR